MIIRGATYDDLDAIIQLYTRGWQTSYAGLIEDDYLRSMTSNSRSRDYLANLFDISRKDAVVLVAESNHSIVGFIACGLNRDTLDKELAEIYAVYVDAASQHQQVGQQLFLACRTAMAERAFKKIRVWTFAANEKAQNAYRRWGGGLSNTTRIVTVAGAELEEVSFDWVLA